VARPLGKLGCFSSLVFAVGIVFALYALVAPWAFHTGGRLDRCGVRSAIPRAQNLYLSSYPEM